MRAQRKLRVVPRAWEPFRREPVADCPIPETPIKPVVYVPQTSPRLAAHLLLQNIHDTTPGGIQREQFIRERHPLKTALAAFPFVALIALFIVAIVTRHHP